jgi:hypothetical protein
VDSARKHAGAPGFFDIDDQLKQLIDLGDPVETFRVDFDLFPARN